MTIYLPSLKKSSPEIFPCVETALLQPDGLLAMGGDLSPSRLLSAYRQGIFPWFSENEPFLWWSPSSRAIFMLNEFHASRSLKKYVRKNPVRCSINQAFFQVITHCALIRGEDKVWITKEMREAYTKLHKLGHAHSVEIWQGHELIGGMYGINIGQIFCAESMFSLADNASKIALWKFTEYFAKQGGLLIECQMLTPHLASLGAKEIPRNEYIQILQNVANIPLPLSSFTPQFLSI